MRCGCALWLCAVAVRCCWIDPPLPLTHRSCGPSTRLMYDSPIFDHLSLPTPPWQRRHTSNLAAGRFAPKLSATCGDFDIIFGTISHAFLSPMPPHHAPCDMLYLVPMLIGSRLGLAIRCSDCLRVSRQTLINDLVTSTPEELDFVRQPRHRFAVVVVMSTVDVDGGGEPIAWWWWWWWWW